MIRKKIESLFIAMSAILAFAGIFTGCKDDEPKVPVLRNDQSAWIELQAEYTFAGVNVFANIYEGSESGQRVRLPGNCKILANDIKMNFLDMPAGYDLFDYGATITGTGLDVKYVLNLPDGTVYNASADIEAAPEVKVPETYTTIENGKSYMVFTEMMTEPVTVKVCLVNTQDVAYDAEVKYGSFVFKDVPAGTYSLRYITTSSSYLLPRGSVAGGVNRIARMNVKAGVIVKH